MVGECQADGELYPLSKGMIVTGLVQCYRVKMWANYCQLF